MIPPKTRTVRPGWRGALAAAWLAACLLPLPAHALGPGCQLDPKQAGNYTQDMGTQAAPGQFAPTFLTLDKSNPPGTVVYDAPLAARALGVRQQQCEHGAFPGVRREHGLGTERVAQDWTETHHQAQRLP
ncbi:hypothetical protein [Achromobacter xylosoxidans]|uniref:hypothetical protein n=1 Tax=Alcaligenes xylosoxydans xylosoxydans TaxID=85698 RepID=UPI001F144003|nr:hypothetical protein [Achromobacter xylosoxidans]